MLTIDEGRISLTRGDTAYLQVAVTFDDGTEYEMEDEDTLTLSVKPDTNNATPYLFSKTIHKGEVFYIEPSDTKEFAYGSYFYDVQLKTAKGEIFTIIVPTRFYITKEVTVE